MESSHKTRKYIPTDYDDDDNKNSNSLPFV